MKLRYCYFTLVSLLLEVCSGLSGLKVEFLRALLDLRYEILRMNVTALEGSIEGGMIIHNQIPEEPSSVFR